MEQLLGDTDNLRMIPFGMHLFNWILAGGRRHVFEDRPEWKSQMNESLPLDYARHLCI